MVTAVVYDIVGERGRRFAQRRAGITSLEEVRFDIERFAWTSPKITWHLVERTTTTETLADHLLDGAATESGHQFELGLAPQT